MRTSDNDLQRVVHRMTTSDKEWQRMVPENIYLIFLFTMYNFYMFNNTDSL